MGELRATMAPMICWAGAPVWDDSDRPVPIKGRKSTTSSTGILLHRTTTNMPGARQFCSQKEMAMRMLGVGQRKVWLDPKKMDVIEKAKTSM